MPSLVPSSIFHGDDVSLCGHRHLVWRTADICCAHFASCCTCSIMTLAVAECSCPFTVVTKWNDIHHYFFKVPWRASQGIPKRKLRQRSTCAASAATSCIQVSSSSISWWRTRVERMLRQIPDRVALWRASWHQEKNATMSFHLRFILLTIVYSHQYIDSAFISHIIYKSHQFGCVSRLSLTINQVFTFFVFFPSLNNRTYLL